jgi:hypothetical protein
MFTFRFKESLSLIIGDVLLCNRQPTLRKKSILAVEAKIMPHLTFRFNLSLTTPLNADFDGDEITCHVPQSVMALAEAKELMSTQDQLLNAQNSRPLGAFFLLAWSFCGLLVFSVIRHFNPIKQFSMAVRLFWKRGIAKMLDFWQSPVLFFLVSSVQVFFCAPVKSTTMSTDTEVLILSCLHFRELGRLQVCCRTWARTCTRLMFKTLRHCVFEISEEGLLCWFLPNGGLQKIPQEDIALLARACFAQRFFRFLKKMPVEYLPLQVFWSQLADDDVQCADFLAAFKPPPTVNALALVYFARLNRNMLDWIEKLPLQVSQVNWTVMHELAQCGATWDDDVSLTLENLKVYWYITMREGTIYWCKDKLSKLAVVLVILLGCAFTQSFFPLRNFATQLIWEFALACVVRLIPKRAFRYLVPRVMWWLFPFGLCLFAWTRARLIHQVCVCEMQVILPRLLQRIFP